MDSKMKRIGYWLTKKKNSKVNWVEFNQISQKYGFELVEINLEEPLEKQGPFTVFLHKLTEIIAQADNDEKCQMLIKNIENYLKQHPEILVIDPLDSVRIIINRYKTYQMIQELNLSTTHNVHVPMFIRLDSIDYDVNLEHFKHFIDRAGDYPYLCKPIIGHGSKQAHKMSLIFNDAGAYLELKHPCIFQKFIAHNARLYKVYAVADRFRVFERPSLKNFHSSVNQSNIYFNSADISKAQSHSALCQLDDIDLHQQNNESSLDLNIVQIIVNRLHNQLQLTLFGFDLIIENNTGKLYLIDLNIYPSYDGYPNFFQELMHHINNRTSSINDNKQLFERNQQKQIIC